MKIINDYLKKLQNKLDTGLSTEHTFREDFSNLLQSLIKDSSITIINPPKNT
ncbi:hypothetical protein [Sulfurihydrogenibium subterraneum]|uniref:hypothetical protein n=1 Tax=Sulfurihydrogenibium subterraneum TaxID=171121 RepID=UPI000A63D7F4|nr:hypothetical protein [Sulfurihydrogenibium subterraneum]